MIDFGFGSLVLIEKAKTMRVVEMVNITIRINDVSSWYLQGKTEDGSFATISDISGISSFGPEDIPIFDIRRYSHIKIVAASYPATISFKQLSL